MRGVGAREGAKAAGGAGREGARAAGGAARARLSVCAAVLVFAGGAACAGRPAAASGQTGDARAAEEPADAGSDGAAGPRACSFEGKDQAPCAEDCDRGIAFACGVLAARVGRADGGRVDVPRAFALYERACELRDAAACVAAARMSASGDGVPPSRAKQVDLLARACDLGDALACAVPAKALAGGGGVAKDERRALELWRRACAGGVESACEALGDAGL